jgi:hypothetical protein
MTEYFLFMLVNKHDHNFINVLSNKFYVNKLFDFILHHFAYFKTVQYHLQPKSQMIKADYFVPKEDSEAGLAKDKNSEFWFFSSEIEKNSFFVEKKQIL